MRLSKPLSQPLSFFTLCCLLFGLLGSHFSAVAESVKSGKLSLTFYEGETPVVGKAILATPISLGETDEDGFLQKTLPAQIYTLKFTHAEQSKAIQVQVVPGENSIVSIDYRNGEFDVDIYEPEPKAIESMAKTESLGLIKGQVKDQASGAPISLARVFVKGVSRSVSTDSVGRFELAAPAGQHVLTVVHPKFSSETVKGVVVEAQASQTVDVQLSPAGLKMDDFVVLAPRKKGSIESLIQLRQKSDEVADVMGAEQIAKSGDSSAGSSLRRVTGLTLVRGQFVYVRGLGERYSNTLLNGVSLPSPDPSRKVVPMDLFPSGILESIVVQKSYSPERSGEFGGGTIMLQTKSFPRKPFVKGSISYSHMELDNYSDYVGGGRDQLGYDDGTRALPEGLSYERQVAGEALQSFSERHTVSRNRNPERLPNFSLSGGRTFKMRKHRLGFLGSILYGNEFRTSTQYDERFGLQGDGNGGSRLRGVSNKFRNRSRNRIKTGITAGVGLNLFRRYKLRNDFIFIRNTDNETAVSSGENEENWLFRDTLLRWTERDLFSHVVTSENKIPLYKGFSWDWHYAHSTARLNEPDMREYRYYDFNRTGEYIFGNLERDDAYSRRYERMQDRAIDIGTKMKFPVPFWGAREGQVVLGTSRLGKRRSSQVKRFALVYEDNASLNKEQNLAQYGLKGSDPLEDQLRRCVGCYRYRDVTAETDNYSATQSVDALFLKTKMPLFSWMDVNFGVRRESSVQRVRTFDLFAAGDSDIESRLQTWNTLPAGSINFKISDKMKIRLAYSETVSRPDFRELSNTRWWDDYLDIAIEGNPALESTVIKNTDLRWEYYFTRKENISFGVFQKQFINPIESVRKPAADPVITFENADLANNFGMEIEFRKNLKGLKGFSLSGNYSVIQSNIQLDNIDTNLTSRSRPLQGQSPYVVNLMLDYENEKKKLNASFLYNIVGKRIFQVGNLSQPDVYEQPFPQLDFVASKSFGKSTSLRFKFGNIFNSRSTFTQGDRVFKQVVDGQTFSIGISTQI